MAIYSGFSHWKWLFSIVMLVYQRVTTNFIGSCSFWWSRRTVDKPTLRSGSVSINTCASVVDACKETSNSPESYSPNTTLVGRLNPSEKYSFVSWDHYSIPNWMEKSWKIIRSCSSHHQPATPSTIKKATTNGDFLVKSWWFFCWSFSVLNR